MGYFLGKSFIKLKPNLPSLVEYHLIEAANKVKANLKLTAFIESEVLNWKKRKDCRKAELEGVFIQQTL